eukprot:980297-Pelagomonas_calceolata.AAC.3
MMCEPEAAAAAAAPAHPQIQNLPRLEAIRFLSAALKSKEIEMRTEAPNAKLSDEDAIKVTLNLVRYMLLPIVSLDSCVVCKLPAVDTKGEQGVPSVDVSREG